MFGDLIGLADGWAPVERVSALSVRPSALRVMRATRFVGPGDRDATTVTIVERPIDKRQGMDPALVVVNAPALAQACGLAVGAYVLDPRLRWWTERARRHVDGPALGVQISVDAGNARGWPAIGSPSRRRVWVRRVRIDPIVLLGDEVGGPASALDMGEIPPLMQELVGVHFGMLTEWPIIAGLRPRRRAKRAVANHIVGPEVCRDALAERRVDLDLRNPADPSSLLGSRRY